MTSFANLRLRAALCFVRPLRWIYWAIRRIALGQTQRWRLVGGKFYMQIDPRDPMDRSFYFGAYEQHLVRLIAATVRPGDVCIDVGAQKGFITSHLAVAVGPRGQVMAFEPDPRAMAALSSNVNRNGFEQVKLFACALGDCDGTCKFVLSRQLGWSSRFPNEAAQAAAASTTSVCTRRLDDVLAEAGLCPETHSLSFMKVDAEGSEPLILPGAQETLEHFRPTIHIEVNKASLNAGGFDTNSIESLLRSLDYELFAISFRRSGWLLRHKLCLTRVASLASGIQDFQDVLAVSPRSLARGTLSGLLARSA
jgi:FkbM family methyltransferase